MKVKSVVATLMLSPFWVGNQVVAQQVQDTLVSGEPKTLVELAVAEMGYEKKQTSQSKSRVKGYLDSRYENYTKIKSGETTDSRFRVQQSRVYIKGNYKEKVSFAMRYRLNATTGTDALEFAFLDYKVNDRWTLSMGKQFVAWGAMEFSYNGSDQYMYTNMLGSMDLFAPGASVTYHTQGQSFKVQGVSLSEQYSAAAYQNKAYAGLFLWEGSLFGDRLKTRYSYGLVQHNGNRYYNWLMLGHRVSWNKWMVELDWMYGYRNVKDDQLALMSAETSPYYVRDNTTTMSIRYKTKKFSPFIKLMYNHRNALQVNSVYAQRGIMGALEYYPFSDLLLKDLRLFATYSYINYDYKESIITPQALDEQQLYIGVRWMVPLF
ncbi:porin [Myroides pelagicus]|uniref:Porin n=1 Tax=Myroides pelagicus TaxID=270914 RepID=A0A7K1GLQ5_9FLAO|nr:porin [Myroides pelagicus]MEC4114198.1 porin [Myroides pelagicus]MTH29756.1 hypothetical protein [Myroides pelagicus]